MRDWTKVKYYPVSIEKLQKASMEEVAYFIAPINIGEDYEYFDEVKHLLDIPEPRKSIDQIQQELNDKIDQLIVKTKRQFTVSQQSADYRFKQFCDNQVSYVISSAGSGSILVSSNYGVKWEPTLSLMPKNSVGYYEITPEYRVGLKQKPSAFVRFMHRFIFNWRWKDA